MDLRKIDALVAEKVMGWDTQEFKNIRTVIAYVEGDEITISEDFCPTEDIQDAWKVVEKLKDKYTFSIYQVKEKYSVSFESLYRATHSGNHEDVSMAICLAALKAVGVEVTEALEKE